VSNCSLLYITQCTEYSCIFHFKISPLQQLQQFRSLHKVDTTAAPEQRNSTVAKSVDILHLHPTVGFWTSWDLQILEGGLLQQVTKLEEWSTFLSNRCPLAFFRFLNKNLAREVHEFLNTANIQQHVQQTHQQAVQYILQTKHTVIMKTSQMLH